MVADLRRAIRLQDLDNRIVQLQHEIASLPRHIAAIEKTLDTHIRKLEADRAALAANQRERKQLELDVRAQEERISKLRDQMLQAKSNEQYAAFKNEIEFCEREIRKCEDRILERMSETEALERNVKIAESALAAEKQQVEAEKEDARGRTGRDKRELDALLKERSSLVSEMPKPLVSTYESIRKRRKGIAVVEAVDGRCTGCHLTMRLQFYQDLRRGDQVMRCESCGRILYYNPPVEVDEIGPAAEVGVPVETQRK